jgi:CHAT domain-containing protein/tetratricopeptide (TPR) repeat protein
MAGLDEQSRRRWLIRFRYAWPIFFVLAFPLRDTGTVAAQDEYNHARSIFFRGDLVGSQQEARQAYARYRHCDCKWASRFQLLEAEVMVWRGMYDDALRILADNHSLRTDRQGEIQKLAIESVALIRQQQMPLADRKLTTAERLCESATDAACGEIFRARGIFFVERGEFSEARQSFLEALALARSHQDRFLAANAILNLGWTALQVDHFDEAMDWSKSAIRACAELGAEDLSERAAGNLGWAYLQLGDTERALDLFLNAEVLAEKLGDIREELKRLTTAGNVYQEMGDIPRAILAYRHALDLAKGINSKEDIINTLEDLAHASIDAGKLGEASGYLQQLGPLLSANNNRLDALYVTLAQARIEAASHDDKDAESLFHEVEKDPASQTSMRFGAEHGLARLYESENKGTDADLMYQTSLSTVELARASLKSDESKLPFLANATGIYDDYIHFLVTQHKTDEALAVADHSRARTLEQGLGVTSNVHSSANSSLHPTEIARKTNATLLFYWLGEHESYLWAITPAKTSMFTLPPRSLIAPLVERYRKALLGLSDPVETSNADGLALYRILAEPARDLIQHGSTVMILDDGALSQLNFETLIASEPVPHYFIEDATLIFAPSLHMLASAKPGEPGGKKLLLVGDAISPNPDYPNLPKAATEMKQIEEHFLTQDETVFARERATAGAYLASAPQQFTYIHFVAHGVASSTAPLDSAIILSRSTAEEDSFKLHARDIMQHPIHARLVTISACYGSGTRSYVGEGPVGLAWAFMRAGAHNVIGGLWEVSDESTPRLMGSLYQGLEDGMPPATALRRAKLELLHAKGEFRKPFFWAPLQIYTGL